MKEKGFEKPIKYIFIGNPNTTKTSLAKRTGLKIFETDSLTEEQVLDIKNYPVDAEVIIVGGKWIKHELQIVSMLSQALKNDYQLIQVRFTVPTYNTLKFFIEELDDVEYSEGGYMVYIATDDRVFQIELDNDDGYRSHADLIPEEEIDGFKFWLKMEGGKEKVIKVEYDKILYGFKEGDSEVIVRAYLNNEVVFEVGTDNTDDYYPWYFFKCKGKDLQDILKEGKEAI